MNNFYKKKAKKKVFFSLLIIFIYILGSNLEIPGTNTQSLLKLSNTSSNIMFGLSMTGLSLNKLSVFSLGLGPWMSSQILWQVMSVTKLFHVQKLTTNQAYKRKYVFSLILGIIQSLSVISQYQGTSVAKLSLSSWLLVLIMVAGLVMLIWLGNLNTQYGLGGSTIIIIVSMLRTGISQIIRNIPRGTFHLMNYLVPFLFILFLSYVILQFYQGERRLPLKHVMLDDKYLSESYLPIPTNPAGGMPLMFAFSSVLFPQYILYVLKDMDPENKIYEKVYEAIQLDRLLGIILLILFLVLLSYGFAYVNIDYKEIAESLKKAGDYFDNVYPGKNTEHYLFDKITRMATVSALFNALIIGIPMLLSLYIKGVGGWTQLISSWLILIILIQQIEKEFSNLYHRNDYQLFVKGE
ncbi:accessory Sec system protein translocase subunit SecY2 [Enterococcus mundtii]|uniref:Accessory Sec system protein translocase subunit SecY2 n=1 Tax=Enterococcus mundtii TaxID=53346 RepID=A0A242KUB5_ENTMU|nr:accessory Sec system protein translocase subunit SecY2 [Enterococcus mundtii]OTP24836.1 accessory Sec system translocase SecY2 [Enterococcus mundtii]